MVTLGVHLTIAKGYPYAVQTAKKIGATTFQFFSRNPRGSSIKKLSKKEIDLFQSLRTQYHIGPLMAHAPYTMNLASSNPSVYAFSQKVFQEDLFRMNDLGIEFFNIHPGSHTGSGIEKGTSSILHAINETLTPHLSTTLLLETMSGKGSEIGFTFDQLATIRNHSLLPEKIGVCMDLCHVFSAGYDIVHHLEDVLTEFDTKIGLSHLKAIHLNDSMMSFGEHKDRHVPIGDGCIGWEAILAIMKHPVLCHLPFYLETPLDEEGHKQEIETIRKKMKV